LSGEVCVALAFAWPPAGVAVEPAAGAVAVVPEPVAAVDVLPELGMPVAAAAACALFCWSTVPTSPGLPTRTVTFAFVGESWVVPAVAVAVGPVPVEGWLPAVLLDAPEVAWLPWLTGPVELPSPTWIERLLFPAPDWSVVAPA
jgi:hypothetical protein